MVAHSTRKGIRAVDQDSHFNNADLSLPGPGDGKSKRTGATKTTAPYTVGNTYIGANGDRSSYKSNCANLTALQGHVAYFDGDCDGVIWPTDTFWGFYYLGCGVLVSLLSVIIIHPAFHYPTLPRNGNRLINFLPDPFMRIYVANIQRDKHGSDSESYNRRGQFQKQKFDEIMSDFSSAPNKDSLSWSDAWTMIKIRRNVMDFFGIFGALFEWGSVFIILGLFGRAPGGKIKVDDIVGVLDGSLLVVLAHEYKEKKRGIAILPKKIR